LKGLGKLLKLANLQVEVQIIFPYKFWEGNYTSLDITKQIFLLKSSCGKTVSKLVFGKKQSFGRFQKRLEQVN
jgi:hypothetical protein